MYPWFDKLSATAFASVIRLLNPTVTLSLFFNNKSNSIASCAQVATCAIPIFKYLSLKVGKPISPEK